MQENDNKIVCCQLTHNHPEVVDQILNLIISDYDSHGIDICIYDDSDDDKTLKVVEKYVSSGATNLYYVDAHGVMGADDKYLHIIMQAGLPKEYDYIWPCKDRTFFRGTALEQLEKMCYENIYDVIMFADEADRWELVWPRIKDVYENPIEYFSHYGQLSTNWESIIYRRQTMLQDVCWEDMMSRTFIGPECNFNQTLFTFSRLLEIEKPLISIIHFEEDERLCSSLVSSGWKNILFDLWINRWVKAIFSLPEAYTPYKMSIVQSECCVPVLFGSTDGFIDHRDKGIFNGEIFNQYRDMLAMISDYPLEQMELIVEDKYDELFSLIMKEFYKSFAEHNYDYAYRLYYTNKWMKFTFQEEDYKDMEFCFKFYQKERNEHGVSKLFDGVESPEQLIEKYRLIKSGKYNG